MANYRLKLARSNSLKLRVSTRIPANLIGNEFITITRGDNGEYYINADYTVLSPGPISDPATAYVAIQDQTSGIYRTVTLASLLVSGLDADLQAIAALTGTGVLSRTADGIWALRTMQAPAAGLTITNPGGVAGNETFALANDLAALESLASTGIAVRSATDTWVQRSVVGGFAVTITNGDGVAGNISVAVTDPELVALAGLVSAADQLPYFTGSGTASLTTLTTFARTLLDDTTQGAMQTTLGLVPGTNVQAFDADLAALAANSGTGLWAVTGAGTGAVRTITAPAAGITVSNGGGVAGNPTLALADDLAAVEGLATTGIVRRTGTSAWSAGTAVANSEMATMAAFTIKLNATGSAAVPTDSTIASLTLKGSPVATDEVIIADNAASGALKRTTVSALASAGSVGSYNGRTGAVTAIGTDVPLRGYISGLTLSAAGATATFGIAAGVSTDSTNVSMMSLASAYTKTTSAWAVGSGNGGLDTGSIAINNWYYVYQIQRPDTGVVDICISASPTAPTFGGNIPAAYTLYRRIGAILTDTSSQWRKFSQIGDEFLWDVPNRDINGGNIATGPGTLVNLLVPNQIKVRAFVAVEYGTSGTVFGLVTSPDQADTAAGVTNFNMVGSATNTNAMFYGEIRTNASGQIRVRTDVAITSNAFVFNRGWSDTRGKDN